jgi:hypothetical protein
VSPPTCAAIASPPQPDRDKRDRAGRPGPRLESSSETVVPASVKYVPELRQVHSRYGDVAQVTIRHLMTHSAGFRAATWPWGGDQGWHPFEPTRWRHRRGRRKRRQRPGRTVVVHRAAPRRGIGGSQRQSERLHLAALYTPAVEVGLSRIVQHRRYLQARSRTYDPRGRQRPSGCRHPRNVVEGWTIAADEGTRTGRDARLAGARAPRPHVV